MMVCPLVYKGTYLVFSMSNVVVQGCLHEWVGWLHVQCAHHAWSWIPIHVGFDVTNMGALTIVKLFILGDELPN